MIDISTQVIATTVEQSLQLMAAGIPTETSDLIWMHQEGPVLKGVYELSVGKYDPERFSGRNGYVLPAWSIGRLFQLVSERTPSFSNPVVSIRSDVREDLIRLLLHGRTVWGECKIKRRFALPNYCER